MQTSEPDSKNGTPGKTAVLGILVFFQSVALGSLVPWVVIAIPTPRPLRENAWLLFHLAFSELWAYPLYLLILSAAMWLCFVRRQYRWATVSGTVMLAPAAFFFLLYFVPERWYR